VDLSAAQEAWLTRHPRFKVTYTPKHASWLNQIELFFSILTRRLLRRAVGFKSEAGVEPNAHAFVLSKPFLLGR
jgi:transposase